MKTLVFTLRSGLLTSVSLVTSYRAELLFLWYVVSHGQEIATLMSVVDT